MKYITATYTDIGIKKSTNQDSMLVLQAKTEIGQVLMAAICDGMGGLAKGEVASATMVYALKDWFSNALPDMIARGFNPEELRSNWESLVVNTSQRIEQYGENNNLRLGTTAVVLLVIENNYYIMNVGDSRAYKISDAVYQLTKDQTLIQQEMDAGRMTLEESLVSPNRSVLLQCIGASRIVSPEFVVGEILPGEVYMLCCDGFRHVIQPSEFYEAFNPKNLKNQKKMLEEAKRITELNKARLENDNISVILIKTV